MEQSILTSTKKILGLDPTYTQFDLDVLTHINTVFSRLTELGIGDPAGFFIEDESAEWDDFLGGDPILGQVKSYVYLRVRMLWDPPSTSYHIAAMQEEIRQMEWRMNVYRESTQWTPGEEVV